MYIYRLISPFPLSLAARPSTPLKNNVCFQKMLIC